MSPVWWLSYYKPLAFLMNSLFDLVYTGVVYCWGHSEGLAHGVTVFLIQLLSFNNFCFLERSDPNKVWSRQSICVNMCQYVSYWCWEVVSDVMYLICLEFRLQRTKTPSAPSLVKVQEHKGKLWYSYNYACHFLLSGPVISVCEATNLLIIS